MVKYVFYFSDNDGNTYTGELSNDNYQGQTIELTGFASITKDLSNNIAQPIQAKAVNVNLLATVDEPLEDIWNEDDRYWLFTLKENSSNVFQGYVSTEEMEQNYTQSKWFLNFDCLDHLSYLEDFGYYDATGLPYSGLDTVFNIIDKCLDKGYNNASEKLGYITAHFLEYNSGDIFKEIYLNQDQFYDDEGEAQDCKTILEDIVKSLGCFIVQLRGNYVIMAISEIARLRTELVPNRRYDSDGNFIILTNFNSNDTRDIIGSEILGFETHFVESNQSFIKQKFYNTFRVRHDFDLSEEVLTNPTLDNDLSTIDGWTLDPTWASLISGGIRINSRTTSGLIFEDAVTSDIVPLKKDDVVTLTYEFEISNSYEFGVRWELELEITDGSETYKLVYKENLGELIWQRVGDPYYDNRLFFTTLDLPNTTNRQEAEFVFPAIPIDGDFTIVFNPPRENDSPASSFTIDLLNVELSPVSQLLEATEHTYRRTDKTTGSVEDTYQIRFNTSDRELVKNKFLDSVGDAIPFFQLVSTGTNVVLADQIALMFLTLFSQNRIEFTGSVKNNFDFTPKSIDKLGTYFLITNEQKDLSRNISSLTLVEVFVGALLSSLYTNETTRIFREPIKPTIIS